jgi:hypothetical protein
MWPFKKPSQTHTVIYLEERGTNTWPFRAVVPEGKIPAWRVFFKCAAVRVPANCAELRASMGAGCTLRGLDYQKYVEPLRNGLLVDMPANIFKKHLKDA